MLNYTWGMRAHDTLCCHLLPISFNLGWLWKLLCTQVRLACCLCTQELTEGDVVSCAGKGRVKIGSITMTKKEKYNVTFIR